MTLSHRHRARGLFLCFIAAFSAAAAGATLQISPVTLDMTSDSTAAGLTLRNPGERPIYGQVRTYRWTQDHGDDVLTPAQELVASPPLLQIAAQSDQLVRLVRVSRDKPPREQSYRVLIDELPSPDAPVTSGITIRLRYSIPVFIEPDTATAPPKLAWSLVRGEQGWLLRVANSGERHAQIAAVQLIDDAGKAYEVTQGLLGYALAGSARQWPVRLDAAPRIRRVQATVNTQKIEAGVGAP
ncbi:fimbrial biogenesis chaperone [Burkholderia alba]|uniref:fimbrial biogenesis chaperone n=1 Tax=Burkholderia alba TaxID=2683677 RepID=UPI002B059737|nr:molecular chaperone [Burkholderia alba]